MRDDSDARRSREAFAALFPAQASAAADDELLSSIVFRDGAAIDINMGERPFYGGDARKITANQVKEFLDHPLRMVMDNFNEAGLLTPLCAKLVNRLLKEMEGTELRIPKEKSTFLVVFGLGLGYHLPELIRATRARWIIVVEPFAELVKIARDVVDWSAIAALLEEREGAIHLVTDLDPARMATDISYWISRHGASYIDGTWVFTHYPLWAFTEGRKQLLVDADNMFAQCGFFEDELKMSRNVAGNFSTRPIWLLNAEPRPQRRETAVVVGAGPSLDDAIDKLKEIRDRVVLFSAGTALRPLLRNGIVPDFHCELENGPEVLDVLQEVGKHGDLTQITLIASLSLDPRVSTLFKDAIFFFRENSSGTALFGGEYRPIRGAVPTCVNTAVSSASFLGFTEFVLFGTDCGIRPGKSDHAEGTVYRDIWKDRPDIVRHYPMEIEGNFGGVAMTNWVLDSCRRMLATAIGRFGLSAVNCSDGALIPGATPKVAEAVEIAAAPVDRQRLLAELKKSMVALEPGELLASFDVSAIREKNKALFRDLADIVDRFDPDAPDFSGVHEALVAFEAEADRKYAEICRISEGTVLAQARIGMYCGTRVTDDDLRRRVNKVFLDMLRESFDEMERQSETLLDQMQQYAAPFLRAEGGSEPQRALVS